MELAENRQVCSRIPPSKKRVGRCLIIRYYVAVSHKDWELPNPRIWLAEIDIDRRRDRLHFAMKTLPSRIQKI